MTFNLNATSAAADETFLLNVPVLQALVGLAVAIDTSAPTTVRLAQTGDVILGRIEAAEYRAAEGLYVVTVLARGGLRFPLSTAGIATPPTWGQTLTGGSVTNPTINGITLTGTIYGFVQAGTVSATLPQIR